MPATLRERNKVKRREAILDSTLALLRSERLSDITTERIAERAEVSAMTVYNLVGTREELLVALIDRVINGLVAELARRMQDGDRDPIADAQMIIEVSSAAFVADSFAFRQILGSMRDFTGAGAKMRVDPSQLQVAAMRRAQIQGIIRGDVDPSAVGKQIYLGYIGAANAWAGGILDDEGFRLAALHGLYVNLVAGSTDRWRDSFTGVFLELSSKLERTQWGQP